jgi:hypothetical protein
MILKIHLLKGWLTGYKSIKWYTNGSIYLKINFLGLIRINRLSLKQILNRNDTIRFSYFQISFSTDGVSFAFLPEV